MDSNELSYHEWIGVLGAGLIAAAMIALAMPSPSETSTSMRGDTVQVPPHASPRSAERQEDPNS